MSDPIRHLHREVARIRRGGTGRGHRYPAALRTRITAQVRRGRARGESLAAIGRDLGLNPFALQRWLDTDGSSGFRTVEVESMASTPAAGTGPVVTLPNGVRIEGLDLSGLLALVRALA